MTVNVMIGDEPTNVYEKMLSFIPAYYLEPDKIPPTENPDDDENAI